MSTSNHRVFWVTNHLANPVLRPLLRGPLGRRLGRRLAVLRYLGRRTGEAHELVVQYVRDGDEVWIVPGQAERKLWWRNMLEPHPVEVWLAGTRISGVARVTQGGAVGGELVKGVAAYRVKFPRAPIATVMVRVELAPVADAEPPATGTTISRADFDHRSPAMRRSGLLASCRGARSSRSQAR